MSRPPWGKVAGECLTEGGNSLSILDCVPTNASTPHRALTGSPPTQRGRHWCILALSHHYEIAATHPTTTTKEGIPCHALQNS